MEGWGYVSILFVCLFVFALFACFFPCLIGVTGYADDGDVGFILKLNGNERPVF